jgi:broad specificity phosphatase PhoE
MTAAPLAALSGIAVEESPLLQERNFGDLRGLPYAGLSEDPFGMRDLSSRVANGRS